ncbi:MAG: RDD family protein [Planctomycetota bacterium]
MSEDPNPYAATSATSYDPYIRSVPEYAELASRWDRFAGAVIDVVCQAVFIIPLSIAIDIWLEMTPELLWGMRVAAEMIEALITGATFLLLNGYLLATRGKTIGKLVMRTTIVDRNTKAVPEFMPLIAKRYLWLWVLELIPFLTWLIWVDILLIFRSSKACLHDDVANTMVIKDVPPTY